MSVLTVPKGGSGRRGRADKSGDSSESGVEPSRAEPRKYGHWIPILVAIGFNLWVLRPETHPGQYLNDASIHASMTRWAAYRIQSGHLPFDGWYPYLSLGASRFHHYQSLPAILTGLFSLAFGGGTFSWTLYLLLASWPLSVYWGGRLLGLGRIPAAIAALVSPLVVSVPSLGYEFNSYVWRGSGTWTQLWGMWMLPLAWGLSWRAVSRRGSLALGALALGLTVCVHLLTGYLALLTVGIWVVIVPKEFWKRLGRAAIVAFGALAVSAWMLVPLLTDAKWVTQDEFSRGTIYYDSFGAPKILKWLVTGGLFDRNRWPVLTVLLAIGIVLAVARFRREESMRAILGAGGLSLLMFFGRPTLGPVLKILPGSSDLFLRRFVFGVHLAGIFLAGIGGWWLATKVFGWFRTISPKLRTASAVAVVGVVGIAFLAPAWTERVSYLATDARWIAAQRIQDAADGSDFNALVEQAKSLGGGRVFAGSRADRSNHYKIGQAPAYAALLNDDADAIGFTRPTWSLLSPVETRFRPNVAAQFDVLNVRYVIFPAGQQPRVPATMVGQSGRHVLWRVDTTGYLTLVDTIAPLTADRTDLGQQVSSVMTSSLLAARMLPTMSFAGRPAAPPTLGATDLPSEPPGSVVSSTANPPDGRFTAKVDAVRTSVVLLKESFDPRWTATVDGKSEPVQMVVPGMPGVEVGPGTHDVSFVYHSYPAYWLLFLAGGLALGVLVLVDRRALRRWRRRRQRLSDEAGGGAGVS